MQSFGKILISFQLKYFIFYPFFHVHPYMVILSIQKGTSGVTTAGSSRVRWVFAYGLR
jgi:hypothetical protein